MRRPGSPRLGGKKTQRHKDAGDAENSFYLFAALCVSASLLWLLTQNLGGKIFLVQQSYRNAHRNSLLSIEVTQLAGAVSELGQLHVHHMSHG
jgi:hypothetical protein